MKTPDHPKLWMIKLLTIHIGEQERAEAKEKHQEEDEAYRAQVQSAATVQEWSEENQTGKLTAKQGPSIVCVWVTFFNCE